nr:retention module-containing protein [uncultured Tolumonas sp.]
MKNLTITEVSHVTTIAGVAKFRTPDGVLHELQVGDILQPGMEILLGDASNFAFEKGLPEAIQTPELPADQQPAMPAMGAANGDQTTAQINALQQAILSGQDPTQAFEAAAAGIAADAGGAGPGSGNDGFISITRVGDATIAESGYDTTAPVTDQLLQINQPAAPTIVAVNNPTIVIPDINSITEGAVATGNVLANDSDVDDVLTVSGFTIAGDSSAHLPGSIATITGVGTLQINGDGTYIFTPDVNWNGNIPQVTYTTNTGASSTLNIEVTPVNDDFTDNNELVHVQEDSLIGGANNTGNVIDGSSVDGPLSLTTFTVAGDATVYNAGQTVTIAGVGALTLQADGDYSFVPVADYNGNVPVVTYTLTDGSGADDTSTLSIIVDPVNDDFTDNNELVHVQEDSLIGGANNTGNVIDGSSVDGPLSLTTFTVAGDATVYNAGQTVTIAGVGALTLQADGDYSFVPVADYNGNVPVVTYTLTDGSGADDTSTLSIIVDPVNDDFTDNNELVHVQEDSLIGGANNTGNVIDGSSVDGPLSLTTFTVAGDATVYNAGQTVTIAGVGALTLQADGDYSFVPVADYNGNVPVVTYTLTDGSGADDTSTLSIIVDPVNDDFTDNNELVHVQEDSLIGGANNTGNVIDGSSVDGPLSLTTFTVAGDATVYNAGQTVTIAGVGALTLQADGDYSFVPVADYNGNVPVVTYTLTDGSGADDTSTLSIIVDPVNDDFTDNNELVHVQEDSLIGGANNTGNVIDGSSVDGPLSLTTFTVAGDATVYNAGQTVTIAGVGALTLQADGDYSFVPVADYNGNVPVVTYTLTDGSGADDTSTLSIIVDPVNDDFTDNNELVHVQEDSLIGGANNTGNVIDGSSVDGPLSLTTFTVAGDATVYNAGQTVTIAGVGALTLQADGDYSFVPVADYNGNVPVVTYTLTDGSGADDTSTLSIIVDPVNDDFTDNNELVHVQEDSLIGGANNTGNVIDGSSVDGPLSLTTFTVAGDATVYNAGQTVTIAGVGALTLQADGDYSFVPVADYNGNVPVVTYTLTDGSGADDTSTLSIIVDPVNDDFTDNNELVHVQEDSLIGGANNTGNVIDGSSVDGPLSLTTFTVAGDATVYNAGQTVTIAGVGALTLQADGDYSFVPVADYNGNVPVVTYTLTDGSGADDTSTLSIIVDPVNDLPVSTDDSVTTTENTPIVLTLNDFGTYSDIDNDAFAGVKITTLEDNGRLQYYNGSSWVDVVLNQAITVQDINAGYLRFVPDANEYGSNYTNISFQVYDGTAYSVNSYDLTVNVTPLPITYDSAKTGWFMNDNKDQDAFDMKIKGGTAYLKAGNTIYWDILVHDSNGNASLTLDPGSLPAGTSLHYDLLYSASGEMMFRVYLSATTTVALSEPNQFDIYVNNADGTSQIINSDEFVKPHESYNYTYDATFDTHTTTITNSTGDGTNLHDQSWLSSDTNGGEFTSSIVNQTGLTVDYHAGDDIVYGTTGNDILTGGLGSDYIDGRAGSDILYGGDGNDTLLGGYGNDILYGGEGNDLLLGGFNNDILDGGNGTDTASFSDASAGVTVNLDTGIATDGSSLDTLTNIENIIGSQYNDSLTGDNGVNNISGGAGNDTLIGGLGNDILTGGTGADIFRWTADDINTASGAPFSDTITDFSRTEGDKLDLSDVLSGDTPSSDLSNYLTFSTTGSNVVVSVHADGNSGGAADMTIVLEGQAGDLSALQNYLLTQNGVIH